MYYPQAPKEPSGCMQTILITRLILMVLFVPLLLIMGCILAVLGAFYALTIHPLLALFVVLLGVGIIVGLGRWESRRIAKEAPPDDR